MTENNKGRRFIITVKTWDHVIFKVLFNKFVELSPENDFKDGERVDVIEYSAYQQALDEITKLKAEKQYWKKNYDVKNGICSELTKENSQLTEALRAAKEYIQRLEPSVLAPTHRTDRHKVLKEIKEVLK